MNKHRMAFIIVNTQWIASDQKRNREVFVVRRGRVRPPPVDPNAAHAAMASVNRDYSSCAAPQRELAMRQVAVP